MTHPSLGRRALLKQTAATLAVAAGTSAGAFWLHGRPGTLSGTGIMKIPSFAVERPTSAPVLSVAHGKEIATVLAAAIGQLGGLEQFIKPGDRVLLKPNVAFDRAPALCATTNPETLRAIIRMVKAAGAGAISITDNPINSPEGAFQKSGITQVADQEGATLILPQPGRFADTVIDGLVLKNWSAMTQPLLAIDKIIGIAPCKDHNLAHASLTMKNWYGLLGGARNRFHQSIHEVICDLARMITPTLVILDGMNMLVSNGPTGGSLGDVKAGQTIACGTDQVAVDAYGYQKMLERDLAELQYVHLATEAGLGQADWQAVNWRETTV